MSALSEPKPMTKRPGRPKRSQRNDITVKIDREIAKKAKFIADTQDVPLAEYLSETFRTIIDRDFSKAVQRYEPKEDKG